MTALLSPATGWAFFSSHSDGRFVSDIVFGLTTLVGRGIQPNMIHVFIPSAAHSALAGFNLTNLHDIAAFGPAYFSGVSHELLVMVVTGHGSEGGLDPLGGTRISPISFLNTIRGCKEQQSAIAVLCQCFAGIFNYIDAVNPMKLALLGATNLSMSVSSPDVDVSGTRLSWQANVFMYHFFRWIAAPIDVDGDSRLTLCDAYRFSGVETGKAINRSKSILSATIHQWAPYLLQKTQDLSLAPMLRAAADQDLTSKLQIIHNHQEPWLLHAAAAREATI